MMWYWGGGVHWWAWMLGFLGMVAFWGLVIWGLWYLVSGAPRSAARHQPTPPPAKQVLDERLARGEIGEDEYRRLRDLITGADQRPAAGGSTVEAEAAGRR